MAAGTPRIWIFDGEITPCFICDLPPADGKSQTETEMYLHGITGEQYEEAAALADTLIERLKPRVLGREAPATSCNCGAVHNAAGRATRITRTAERYPEQVLSPFSVEITPHGSTGNVYRLPLTMFIPWEELRDLWKETFTPFLIRHFPSTEEALRSGANDHLWGF